MKAIVFAGALCISMAMPAVAQTVTAQTIPQGPVLRGPAIPVNDATRAGGITVYGSGVSEVVVHTVNITAYVRSVNGNPADVLAAMRAAGIESPGIGPGTAFISANTPLMLHGTIRNATRERLDAVGRAAAAYVLAHPGTAVDSVQYSGVPDDCPAIEKRAREAAFTEARRRAESIAVVAGVIAGPPTNISESGGCYNFNVNAAPLDTETLTMRITVNETVMFSIVRKP
jgi:uncharacterized protein YggE